MPQQRRQSLLRRFASAFAFAMRHSGAGGGTRGWSGFVSRLLGALPGTNYNLAREVGDPAQNSVVAICLNWLCDQFSEAPLEIAGLRADQTWAPVPLHPLAELIGNPNEYYDGDALWGATLTSYLVDGNAYWLKARGMGGLGRPAQLYYVPHWQMEPRWGPDGATFITHYDYLVDGRAYSLPRESVVHFFDKIDPLRRKGISRLYPALRSIGADNEADTFCFAILKNMGIPGVLLSPKDPLATVGKDARDELEEIWTEGFTGDNRGRPLLPNFALEVTKLSFTPEELVLDRIREIPIQRVCSSLRVKPLVVGLGPVPRGFDNGGQAAEARRAAYLDGVCPLHKRCARVVTRQLGPDFDLAASEQARFNYDAVEAMQEDRDRHSARVRADFTAGVIMRSEARNAGGYRAIPARDDVFVSSVSVVPADNLEGQRPQPPPALPPGDEDEEEEAANAR